MTNGIREVWPPKGKWPYRYRARIEHRNLRFRGERWRYVIERFWVHWSDDTWGGWFKTREEAEKAADRKLDSLEGKNDGRVGYLTN